MRHPRRVRRLVLVSPVGWTPKPAGARAAKRAIADRLNLHDATERTLVARYFWSSLTAHRASAEVAVNYLLEPHYGVVADGLYAFYAKRAVADEPAEMLANLPP